MRSESVNYMNILTLILPNWGRGRMWHPTTIFICSHLFFFNKKLFYYFTPTESTKKQTKSAVTTKNK